MRSNLIREAAAQMRDYGYVLDATMRQLSAHEVLAAYELVARGA